MLRLRSRRYAPVCARLGPDRTQGCRHQTAAGYEHAYGDVIASRHAGRQGQALAIGITWIATSTLAARRPATELALLLSRDVKTASTVVQEDELVENAQVQHVGETHISGRRQTLVLLIKGAVNL